MNKFKSVNFIVSAKDYGGSARGYIRKMQADVFKRGVRMQIKNLDGEPTGTPVIARIWQGQWIAECECGGASFVDPDEPVFVCFGCGNRVNDNQPRPVTFPKEWKKIEKLLLQRPVDDMAGLTDLERAGMAKAVIFVERTVYENGQERVITLPLTRSWNPGETLDDLRAQQDDAIRKWNKNLSEGEEIASLRSQ